MIRWRFKNRHESRSRYGFDDNLYHCYINDENFTLTGMLEVPSSKVSEAINLLLFEYNKYYGKTFEYFWKDVLKMGY